MKRGDRYGGSSSSGVSGSTSRSGSTARPRDGRVSAGWEAKWNIQETHLQNAIDEGRKAWAMTLLEPSTAAQHDLRAVAAERMSFEEARRAWDHLPPHYDYPIPEGMSPEEAHARYIASRKAELTRHEQSMRSVAQRRQFREHLAEDAIQGMTTEYFRGAARHHRVKLPVHRALPTGLTGEQPSVPHDLLRLTLKGKTSGPHARWEHVNPDA
ncbi:hypothetical protein CBS101457_004865 [Exobasidium rhododendri]|nr:hypothetical protein CBS101457_004865 [Exobasidium rhododendri]